jgi:hypothetical protein
MTAAVSEQDPKARLFVQETSAGSHRLSLWLSDTKISDNNRWYHKPQAPILLQKISGGRAEPLLALNADKDTNDRELFRLHNPRERYDLRVSSASGWNVRTGFWAAEGLYASNPHAPSRWAALEFPGLGYPASSSILLPGDQVVLQWGDDPGPRQRTNGKNHSGTRSRGRP